MARGVWRRSGEAFSAYCARQIKAHDEEIERCTIVEDQSQKEGRIGRAMFYASKIDMETHRRDGWREQMRAALITEGQADKNSADAEQRLAARIKLQSANSSYGKLPDVEKLNLSTVYGKFSAEPHEYKTTPVYDPRSGITFDIANYPLEPR